MTEAEKQKTRTQIAIYTNLDMMSDWLARAAALACEACAAMEKGEQNQAIGTILGFEKELPEMVSLFNAILVLHRSSR
jgi:hypothetical protein